MDKHLIISEKDKLLRIPCALILFLKADGNYTHVFLKEKKRHTASKSLGQLQSQLNPEYFHRCDDSFIVSLAEVVVYEKARGGYAVMTDGSKIPISFRKKKAFLIAFNSK